MSNQADSVIELDSCKYCRVLSVPQSDIFSFRGSIMLSGECVLVAEDECLIAMDLADLFETAGANVIGPASTVQEALKLIRSQQVDRACLDFNLADGEVTPVLDLLASKGIPMVVYTGRGLPKELSWKHPALTVLHKPLPPKRLVTELARAKAN